MGGHLYTKAEIERVGARGWMDAARLTGGVSVIMYPVRAGSTLMGRRLSMMGSGGRCTPAVFVDALRQNIIEFDWDDFLAVTAIESMEVYSSTSAPPEFRSLTGTYGSVVIWTHQER